MKRINFDKVISGLYFVLSISMVIFVCVLCIMKFNDFEKRIDDLEQKIDILASDTDVRVGNLNMTVKKVETDICKLNGRIDANKKEIEDCTDELEADIKDLYEKLETTEEQTTEEEIDILDKVSEEVTPTKVSAASIIKYPDSVADLYIEDDGIKTSLPQGPHLTPEAGVFNGPSGLETYYNLDMSVIVQVAHSNGIGGEYWIREDGVKMLGDYIMCACNRDVHPYGTLVQTSLGMGISLDTGGFAANNPTQIDIAVNW